MPFIIIGALVSLGSVVETVEWGPFGVGMGIFGFGMLMFILAKYFTAARKISYKIDQEGIILKSTRGGTKQIPHSEIETVNLLIEKQAEEVLYKMRLKLEEKNAAIMRGEEEAKSPLGRMGSPKDIAKLVAFLASDENKFISGAIISVDGASTQSLL